jgi:hypothetical protein
VALPARTLASEAAASGAPTRLRETRTRAGRLDHDELEGAWTRAARATTLELRPRAAGCRWRRHAAAAPGALRKVHRAALACTHAYAGGNGARSAVGHGRGPLLAGAPARADHGLLAAMPPAPARAGPRPARRARRAGGDR